ncbi:MAG: type II secretion system protein GspM [Pseudomonadota bacterium]
MSLLTSLRQSWQEAAAPLLQRWTLLQEREQRALMMLGAALLAFLLWGLWLSSHRAAEKAEQQLTASRLLLRELQQAAPAAVAGGGGSVLRTASDAATASGLALGRIEPEGEGRVRVWLERADFNAVAGWLAALSRQGIRVEEAQVEKLAEGGVSARLSLAR